MKHPPPRNPRSPRSPRNPRKFSPEFPGVGLMCVVAMLVMAGCTSNRPVLSDEKLDQLSARVYPADAEWGDDLDILVVREAGQLQLVNRTPRVYKNVTLWLNQQYVRPIKQIDIGTDNTINLHKVINQHRQSYPVGSFLKPDKSMLLVQAELIDPATGLRHRLTVQPPQNRR